MSAQLSKYNWERLQSRGDWLVIEGADPIHVSSTVKAYIKRHFGPAALVITRKVSDGTFVCLADVPNAVQAHHYAIMSQPDDEDPDEDIRQFLDD